MGDVANPWYFVELHLADCRASLQFKGLAFFSSIQFPHGE